MKERYKVLGAMTALGEFTVEDVVRRTGVKQNTVSTIMARDKGLLEEIGYEETGRRGGKPKRYRLRPESAELLHSELEDLYRNLPAPLNREGTEVRQEPKLVTVPLGLLAAEDTLLLRYPREEDSKEKQRILNLAKLDYQKGFFESERILAAAPEREVRTMIENSVHRVKALQKFFELDVLASSYMPDQQDEAVEASTLRGRLSELSSQISEAISNLHPVLVSSRQASTGIEAASQRPLRPQSEDYITARGLLDRASVELHQQQRSALLKEASASMAGLQKDYEGGDTHPITNAFIRYEEGRLRFLMRDYEAARKLFEGARDVFATSAKYSDEIAKIDHHLAILSVHESLMSPTDASAGIEIAATLSALEKIDDRSKANYPLVRFLQNLLSKTIHRFSETERLLRQELADARRQLRSRDVMQPQLWQQIPSPEYHLELSHTRIGYGRDLSGMVGERMGIFHEHPCHTSEARELKAAVALGSENTLSCSPFDQMAPSRSKYDLPILLMVGTK
ncbi:MAG: hypothetical protein AABM67_18685 [Acidobacteriota bacterium]